MSNITECEVHGLINCADCNAPAESTIFVVGEAPKTRRRRANAWADWEIVLAEDLNLEDAQISEATGRTSNAVHMFRLQHGIVEKAHDRTIEDQPRAMARWTEAEIDFIRIQRFDTSNEDMAATLGRSVAAVERMVRRFR
jgi:hypothetical protein